MHRLVFTLINCLISAIAIGQQKPEKSFQLFGGFQDNCGDNVVFDKSPNWYGVYSTSQGEFLRKVEVEKAEANQQEDKLIFMLGTTEQLEEKGVSQLGKDYFQQSHIYYPGQTTSIYTTQGIPLEMKVTGNVKSINYCPEIEDLKYIISTNGVDPKEQNLYPSIEYQGECGLVSIAWFGDVDQDNKPDILLSTSSTKGSQFNLYLSSMSGETEILGHIPPFTYENCY